MAAPVSPVATMMRMRAAAAADPSRTDEVHALEEALFAMHELAEAHRRAGAAEHHLETERDRRIKADHWLADAKEQAGYSRHISFDVVWDEVLASSRLRQQSPTAAPPEGTHRDGLLQAAQGFLHAWRAKYKNSDGSIRANAPFQEQIGPLALQVNEAMLAARRGENGGSSS